MEAVGEALSNAAPQEVEQWIGALLSIVLAVIAAFRRGKKVGRAGE